MKFKDMNAVESVNYFLLSGLEREVIVHRETGLRINIFNLENEVFRAKSGELHIFGDDHGGWLAFETEGWTNQGLRFISEAVLWYAYYLDYPQMKVALDYPKLQFKLKKC